MPKYRFVLGCLAVVMGLSALPAQPPKPALGPFT